VSGLSDIRDSQHRESGVHAGIRVQAASTSKKGSVEKTSSRSPDPKLV
jgi:hypothetical protein